MSQTINKGAVSKLCIKNKAPGTISTGANTEITLDGKKLRGVCFLKLEFKPKNVTKVTMEMYCEVDVETDINFTSEIPKDNKIRIGDAVYTLSEYSTVGIAEKPNKT